MAIIRCQFAAQPTQLQNRINATHQMIRRHQTIKAHIIEKTILIPPLPAHHRASPSSLI